MKQFVWEVLAEVKTAKKKEEKIKILKDNRSWALLDIIRGSLDSSVQWDLPQGPVPFTRCDPHNAPSNLMRQNVIDKFLQHIKRGNSGGLLELYTGFGKTVYLFLSSILILFVKFS